MTHQTKSQMHPEDIEAMNSRREFLTDEFKESLVKALLHKNMTVTLAFADPCDLRKFAQALEVLASNAERLDQHEREMRKAGL